MSKEIIAKPPTVSRRELLIDGSDIAFRDFLSDFFAFSQQLQDIRTRFAAAIGLSAVQYMILIAIDRLEDRDETGINTLAAHLHYSGAFVTIEVNQLVKLKLVEKAAHPTDGRRVVLKVTELGSLRLSELANLQRPINDELFSNLDADAFRRLTVTMREFCANGTSAIKLADYVLPPRPRGGDGGDDGSAA